MRRIVTVLPLVTFFGVMGLYAGIVATLLAVYIDGFVFRAIGTLVLVIGVAAVSARWRPHKDTDRRAGQWEVIGFLDRYGALEFRNKRPDHFNMAMDLVRLAKMEFEFPLDEDTDATTPSPEPSEGRHPG